MRTTSISTETNPEMSAQSPDEIDDAPDRDELRRQLRVAVEPPVEAAAAGLDPYDVATREEHEYVPEKEPLDNTCDLYL